MQVSKVPYINVAVKHLFICSREEAKRNAVPATLPRQLSHFLKRAPPGQVVVAC